MTILPLFLQDAMGYTALQSGLAQMPRGLGLMIIMPLVGILVGKVDVRKLVATGFLLAGVTTALLSNINLGMTSSHVAIPNFFPGFGLALIMVPLLTTSMGTLANEQMGNAAGLLNLSRNLGASVGISLATAMVDRLAQVHQAVMVSHVTPYDPAYQLAVSGAHAALSAPMGSSAASAAPASIYNLLLQQSNLLAFIDDFRRLALLSLVAIPAVMLFKRVAAPSGPIVAH